MRAALGSRCDSLSGALGPGGRAHPAPCARHPLLLRKTTGAVLPPASHPGGSPTSSTLAGEEGFMQRARRADSGPAGGGAQRLGPPRAHSALGCSPESRGQLGPAELCSCRRTTPLTPVSGRQRLPPGRSACSTQRSVARRGGRLPSRRIQGPLSVPA